MLIFVIKTYKCIIQLTFHVKQSHACTSDFKKKKKHRFYVVFIYLAGMNFRVGPFVCNPENSCKNCLEVRQIFPIRQVKSSWKFHHALKAFPNFSFVCFHLKITWHLGKVNEKVNTEKVSNWVDTQSSCLKVHEFQRPPLLTP